MNAKPNPMELIPHRPPMLLIEEVLNVSNERAESLLWLSTDSPFYVPERGVPNWVGLEYMGQTAALIAGYQQQTGQCLPHLGFLLGCREYLSEVTHFKAGTCLHVQAEQSTVVGESLATFKCTIATFDAEVETVVSELATAQLSVFRQPL